VFVRGLYVLADPNQNHFVMNVRPLHDIFDSGMGSVTVDVDANTIYFINGTNYVGAAGLTALSKLQNVYADLQIAAYGPASGNPFGSLDTIQPSMTATQVYVGSSFESTLEDQLTGTVRSISGNTITVHDASAFINQLDNLLYKQDVPVTVSNNTLVRTDGDVNNSTVNAISVGQTVTVLGQAAINATTGLPDSFDATGNTVSGNLIRIQDTTLIGTVNSSSAGSLSLNLLSINDFVPGPLSLIDFTGTGAGGNDATPSNYVVTSPTVDASQFAPGTLVKVTGKTTPFGAGPPYFTANSITSTFDEQLIIEWGPLNSTVGALNPFSAVNGGAIDVNLNDASLASPATSGSSAVIKTGPLLTYDLLANAPAQVSGLPAGHIGITYNTDASRSNLFGVGSDTVGAYMDTNPSDFANHVLIVNDGKLPIHKLVAYGQYDPNTHYFTANRITINSQ
jgi:hypothetical protein